MYKSLYFLPMTLALGMGAAGAGQPTTAPITTAASVAAGQEDQPVQIRGKIVSRQGRNHYVVADDTGSTLVKIPRRMRNGAPLLPGMEVRIDGEVDTSTRRPTKVEATALTVLTSNNNGTYREPTEPAQPEPEKP